MFLNTSTKNWYTFQRGKTNIGVLPLLVDLYNYIYI